MSRKLGPPALGSGRFLTRAEALHLGISPGIPIGVWRDHVGHLTFWTKHGKEKGASLEPYRSQYGLGIKLETFWYIR